MTEETFKDQIKKELNLDLSPQIIINLKKYCAFLLEYNEHTNLTAIKTPEEVYLKHFFDSLTITKILHIEKNQKILDIGTGAGFPGLVLAICFPNLEVHLLDSNNKKINFLNEIIKILNLQNVKTIYNRTEEYAKTNQEQYDVITSRAVAELRILIETSFPLLKRNGLLLAMKSNVEEEIKNSEGILSQIYGSIEHIEKFSLPFDTGLRTIIKIKKLASTPSTYPRAYATILKKPLKKL
ncbi:MAG: 16S rRNA (guanine(527)-N(7))-methyltransferase RsmG [Bacilli bacterium]|jgi:16S rRNA (guanine527-N7)-methyltransferase|nr:16S rRNA (guanine(527)-N(7))-methyltransferase RsmG [Bacilli bacterium]